MEKVGEVRTVKRILEVMIEKFAKTTGEKTLEMMRRISGNGFQSDERGFSLFFTSPYPGDSICFF